MATQEERERKDRAYANRLSKMGKQQQRIFTEQGEDNRSPRSPRQRRMFLEDEVFHVSCGFFTCLVVVKKADVLPLLPYTSCAFFTCLAAVASPHTSSSNWWYG